MNRHMPVLPVKYDAPSIGSNAFIAASGLVSGKAKLGDNVTVWYGAAVRGELCTDVHAWSRTFVWRFSDLPEPHLDLQVTSLRIGPLSFATSACSDRPGRALGVNLSQVSTSLSRSATTPTSRTALWWAG